MIYLNKSALQYAINVCLEEPGYKIIMVCKQKNLDMIFEDVRRATPIDQISCLTRHEIGFKNGSRILIVPPTENARGHRAHLVIAERHTDEDTFNQVFRPMEILEHFKK